MAKLTKTQQAELKEILNRQVEEIKHHFTKKSQGWPLDYTYYETDAIADLFPGIYRMILKELTEQPDRVWDLKFEPSNEKGLQITLVKRYLPKTKAKAKKEPKSAKKNR